MTSRASSRNILRAPSLTRRLKEAAAPVLEEGKTTCCCARSEKSWTLDPQGVSWETFLTTGPHHRREHGLRHEHAQRREAEARRLLPTRQACILVVAVTGSWSAILDSSPCAWDRRPCPWP